MKYLIKTLVIIGLITFTLSAQAQVKYGIKAGVNFANVAQNFEDSDFESDTKARVAYHFGLTLDYAISEEVSLQSGLLYTGKGFALDLESELREYYGDGASIDGYDRAALNYLEIPINVAYKVKGFQIYAGPYLAAGISGKNKYDYTLTYSYFGSEYSGSEKGDFRYKPVFGEVSSGDLDDEEGAFQGLDYGLNIGVGYNVGPVVVSAGYSLGLGNITPKYEGSSVDIGDFKASNRVLNVSVAYMFGE